MRNQLSNPFLRFAEGEGDGGGGDGKPAGDGKPNDGGTGDGEKKFTQADIDRIVAERAKRVAAKDYGDYDDLKKAAQELADLKAAGASEQDRAVQKATSEAEKRVRDEVNRDRVLDFVEVAAAKDWADPLDARLRLQRRAAEFVGKDGSIDRDAIKAAVADELKSAAHLAAMPAKGKPRPDGTQGTGGDGAPKGFGSSGAAEAARRFQKPAQTK